MSTCFVIQPFDQGPFDKRYEDTFRPAIIAAGLEPYRVDEDPGCAVPIEDIEAGIRRSQVCFAEITTDNPNVWFELGYAIASQKPVVMVCAEDRQKFPFDVQHRSIVRYTTESPRDFADLGANITKRLKGAVATQMRVQSVTALSPAAPTAGLTEHELVALITIAAAVVDDDPVTAYTLRQEMNRSGYTDVACVLAIRSLERKEFIERASGYDGNNEFFGFIANDAGVDWLDSNQALLKLKELPGAPPATQPWGEEDDLPF